MRFPTDWIPPISGVEETGEIKQVWTIRPIKPLDGQTIAPAILRRHREATPLLETHSPVPIAARQGEDRRKYCRRISNQPTLLDTRSGNDRRRQKRRESDTATAIAVKA